MALSIPLVGHPYAYQVVGPLLEGDPCEVGLVVDRHVEASQEEVLLAFLVGLPVGL